MKNIFARGGIEFLAVMLGISVSLWVDERRIEANSQEDFQADLFAIHNELKDDLITINSAMDFNSDMLNKFRHLLSVMEKDKIDLSALDTIPLFNSYPENRSFFGKKSAYLASKSSGHLNRNSHLIIVQELTKLYDQIYSRMEANNEFMDKIAAEADSWKWYISYPLRGHIYEPNDFIKKINSSEFYNWAVKNEFLFTFFVSIMETTRKNMIVVEGELNDFILQKNKI